MSKMRNHIARDAACVFWRFGTAAYDLLPAGLRYGHARTLLNRLLACDDVRSVWPMDSESFLSMQQMNYQSAAPTVGGSDVHCVLVTSGLHLGGVESVVAMLARHLPSFGISVSVICARRGATADLLSSQEVRVIEVAGSSCASEIRRMRPDVVQLHNAPEELNSAISTLGIPYVPVIHNIELNRGPAEWDSAAVLCRSAYAVAAVSEAVARFHARHVPTATALPVVIPNAADPDVVRNRVPRCAARQALQNALGVQISDDVIFVTLARYDEQKNLAGLVAAYGECAVDAPRSRLVVAGDVASLLEYRRAASVARRLGCENRVHLLANSDPRVLLGAADAFVLDSFFEGWPLSATEAATYGLPVVMPNVGGAVEIVGPSSERGYIVSNPAGPSEEICRGAIRRARRARRQLNTAELAEAMRRIATSSDEWRSRQVIRSDSFAKAFSFESMIRRHAVLLRSAASGTNSRFAADSP